MITLTWQQLTFVISLVLAWAGFLIGVIRWSLKRNLASFEGKIAEANAQATKVAQELASHKEEYQKDRANMERKMAARHDCQYHQGFEKRLDQMNGSINKIEGLIEGRMEGIGSSLDLIQQHLLSGGK